MSDEDGQAIFFFGKWIGHCSDPPLPMLDDEPDAFDEEPLELKELLCALAMADR
jgi:hypothetical protein